MKCPCPIQRTLESYDVEDNARIPPRRADKTKMEAMSEYKKYLHVERLGSEECEGLLDNDALQGPRMEEPLWPHSLR